MSNPISAPRHRAINRFIRFAIFFVISVFLFVGGGAALLYLVFSNYTGIQNIWLLVCGAPFAFIVMLLLLVINLYMRFGRPLEELFNAINAVEAGNLATRVPEDKSDLFSDLFKRFNKMVGELERAEQQRRNLTADVAHELRTPLHIIQGNLEGVLDGVYEPTSEHINNTLDETRLLARLVNDLQMLSLAEAGQLPLHVSRFLVGDLLQDLAASFSSQAAGRGVDLAAHTAAPELEISADYDRLNQALSNLIANALRYTPPGGRVSIEAGAAPDQPDTLRITVQDTGAGIPAEDLPFIFDRFWRGDRSRSERNHSGLGLAITRQLVQAHGGRIDAQSSLGQGTTFTIELAEASR